jgi:hypothetical protein
MAATTPTTTSAEQAQRSIIEALRSLSIAEQDADQLDPDLAFDVGCALSSARAALSRAQVMVAKDQHQHALYLLTKPGAADYLAGGSRIEETVGPVTIVACPPAEVDWQLGRLVSGLQHVTRDRYPDLESARQAARKLAA